MRNGLFKLRQFYDNAYAKLDGVVFGLRLKYLGWRYGGISKVPHDKLPPIFVGVPGEEVALLHMVHASVVLDALCEHYRLERRETSVASMLQCWVCNSFDNPEAQRAMWALLQAPDLEVRIFRILKECEDITQAKLAFYGPPAPFDSMEAWLVSLKDPRRLKHVRS